MLRLPFRSRVWRELRNGTRASARPISRRRYPKIRNGLKPIFHLGLTRQTDTHVSQTTTRQHQTLPNHGQINAMDLRIITSYRQTTPLLSQATTYTFQTFPLSIPIDRHHSQTDPHNPQTDPHNPQTGANTLRTKADTPKTGTHILRTIPHPLQIAAHDVETVTHRHRIKTGKSLSAPPD